MREVITQTYFIALPILLGYMVWLLQEQKKKQTRYVKERDERIAEERAMRKANSMATNDEPLNEDAFLLKKISKEA